MMKAIASQSISASATCHAGANVVSCCVGGDWHSPPVPQSCPACPPCPNRGHGRKVTAPMQTVPVHHSWELGKNCHSVAAPTAPCSASTKPLSPSWLVHLLDLVCAHISRQSGVAVLSPMATVRAFNSAVVHLDPNTFLPCAHCPNTTRPQEPFSPQIHISTHSNLEFQQRPKMQNKTAVNLVVGAFATGIVAGWVLNKYTRTVGGVGLPHP